VVVIWIEVSLLGHQTGNAHGANDLSIRPATREAYDGTQPVKRRTEEKGKELDNMKESGECTI
jgi:hypothetical protein